VCQSSPADQSQLTCVHRNNATSVKLKPDSITFNPIECQGAQSEDAKGREPGIGAAWMCTEKQSDQQSSWIPPHTSVRITAKRAPDTCPFALDESLPKLLPGRMPPTGYRSLGHAGYTHTPGQSSSGTAAEPMLYSAGFQQLVHSPHQNTRLYEQVRSIDAGHVLGQRSAPWQAGSPSSPTARGEGLSEAWDKDNGIQMRAMISDTSVATGCAKLNSRQYMAALATLRAGPSDSQKAHAESVKAQLKRDLEAQVFLHHHFCTVNGYFQVTVALDGPEMLSQVQRDCTGSCTEGYSQKNFRGVFDNQPHELMIFYSNYVCSVCHS
jgi:hypothetical protein